MSDPVGDFGELLRHMRPVLNPGTFVFCALPAGADVSAIPAIGTFREPEGITVIVDEREAMALTLTPVFRAAWITLTVHSDLEAVGLTAAVAGSLAAAGISCNVVAGVYHDHLFVPADQGQAALAALVEMQRNARKGDAPGRPRERGPVTRTRLEAYSDGVVAIIITIMVLELKVRRGADLESLRPVLPEFLSCVFVAIMWLVPDRRMAKAVAPTPSE